MPWCEDCAKYFAPSAMSPDGSCPSCGRSLEPTPAETTTTTKRVTAKDLDLRKMAAGGDDATDEEMKTPWHFKLMMVLLALYLGWRIVQLFA